MSPLFLLIYNKNGSFIIRMIDRYWKVNMKINKKILVAPISIAILGATIATPILTTTKQKNIIKLVSEKSAATSTVSYQFLSPCSINEEGFTKMMETAKENYFKNNNLTFTKGQIKTWFLKNEQKALESIVQINALIEHRTFMDWLKGGAYLSTIAAAISTIISQWA